MHSRVTTAAAAAFEVSQGLRLPHVVIEAEALAIMCRLNCTEPCELIVLEFSDTQS
jgi:hypothetical protein